MPVSPKVILDLIRKMKEGSITRLKMLILQIYFTSSESDKTLEEVDFSTLPEAADSPGRDADERFREIMKIIQRQSNPYFQRRKWIAAASIIVITASTATLLFLHRASKGNSGVLAVSELIFRSGDGEVKHVQLPDGTLVELNARSVLVCGADFGRKDRVVILQEGEAFFDVKKDPLRPFSVRDINGIETKVLGTAFDCKAYGYMAKTEVGVKSGRVQVVQRGQPLGKNLTAGDMLTYDLLQSKLSTGKTDADLVGNWRTGEVALQLADFPSMVSVIRQLYGKKIVTDNRDVLNNLYSIRIHYRSNIDTLLNAICAINGNQFRWNTDGTVHIY